MLPGITSHYLKLQRGGDPLGPILRWRHVDALFKASPKVLTRVKPWVPSKVAKRGRRGKWVARRS